MNAIQHIVNHCGGLKQNESVLVLYDDSTSIVTELFLEYLFNNNVDFSSIKLEQSDVHGKEPSNEVAKRMIESDLILCLTHNSLAHTEARLNATNGKSRFLSLPHYSVNLLDNSAITVDYFKVLAEVELMTKILSEGKEMLIETDLGTRLKLKIEARKGNCAPGFVDSIYPLGSPPDIEANIAPIETLSEGTLVIDGSITHPKLGLLKENVILIIENGKIKSFHSKKQDYCRVLESIFREVDDEKAYYLAEVGIGFNKRANLTGNMLVDEGAYGYVHFGFGSNHTIQGTNKVSFHLDFVMAKANMYIDGIEVIKEGEIVL